MKHSLLWGGGAEQGLATSFLRSGGGALSDCSPFPGSVAVLKYNRRVLKRVFSILLLPYISLLASADLVSNLLAFVLALP